ncbi:MAG: lipoprotein-releasing ABC transporter permease subunit [Pseudomonadales bacterium]|nr:lipoprotein-releasing ABC transporter permease subunit [Pseudomonadales bacterium]
MLKSLSFFIGTRYILARHDNRFISFTSLISMAGLTLGVLALIIVLSVFNGSQGIMRDRTLITVPHADIYREEGSFSDWRSVRQRLLEEARILAVSPYVQAEAMLSQRGYHQVATIKAIVPDAEMSVSTLEDSMVQGSLSDLQPGRQGIILGRVLAGNLRLNVGDAVNLIVPELQMDSADFRLNMHRFTVVGVFDVRFNIGAELALIHLDDSPGLLGLDSVDEALHLRLKVDDIDAAATIVEQTLAQLGPGYGGEDWSIAEASLFNALKMEKIMTTFMLMMIVAIGAFNIVSTLVMVVSDKQADIAILRTMGAGQRSIMGVFMVQGITVGLIGTALGALLGIAIVMNFEFLGALLEGIISPSGVYILSALPAELQRQDVILICSSALIISFLATLYPAYKASRIHPAEVLRYE